MWEWRKLHNAALKDLYSSSSVEGVIKSRRKTLTGHVARMGERRGICRVLAGKSEEKRPLGRLRHRWGIYIKMDLQEVGCGALTWLGCLWISTCGSYL
jgi:hypothetical protein